MSVAAFCQLLSDPSAAQRKVLLGPLGRASRVGTFSGAALPPGGQGRPPFPAEAAAPATGRPEAGTSLLARVWGRAMSSWCVRSSLLSPAVLWCTDRTGRVDTRAGSHGVHTKRLPSRSSGKLRGSLFCRRCFATVALPVSGRRFQSWCLVLQRPARSPAQSRPAVPFFDLQRRGGSRAMGGRRLPHARCNERTIWLPSGCFLA